MGCAASSTVNTADDIKPINELRNGEKTPSPKLTLDSKDLDINETMNFGDQIEKNKDIIEETTNFHNSPVIISSERQSLVSSSKSISHTNRRSESLKPENLNSKSDENVANSPTVSKVKLDNNDNLSNASLPISNKILEKNYSKISISEKIGDSKLLDGSNSQKDMKESNINVEKVYQMVSPQESILSSHKSNIVYKPTYSSDDELNATKSPFTVRNESKEELNHANNSRSVMSDSKTLENKPEEFWNQEPKLTSNANSVNNIDYEKSSRNSGFSHTYTGSIHSPFFDSLNHGNIHFDDEENQNHDEVTETINDRVLLGTGDSEQWTNVNQNYQSDLQNVSSSKGHDPDVELSNQKKSQITNLSATGDKSIEHLEQSNEDNTLDTDNNQIQNDVVEHNRQNSEIHLFNQPDACDRISVNRKMLSNESIHTSLKNDFLKTAEVNDSKCEGMLIGITSSPNNFQVNQLQDQFTIMDTEEAIHSTKHNHEF